MNFDKVPVAFAWRYRNSATSLSVALLARADVEGFGGRLARKSPYAGPSCSLTSVAGSVISGHVNIRILRGTHTVDGLALRQVTVALLGEQLVAISSYNAFDVAACASVTVRVKERADSPEVDIVEDTFHLAGSIVDSYAM